MHEDCRALRREIYRNTEKIADVHEALHDIIKDEVRRLITA